MPDISFHTGATEITPEEAGFHPPRLSALDALFARLVERKKLQAAGYLLARRGKIFAWRTLGSLVQDSPDAPDGSAGPFLPDSLLAIGPITQAVTAVALFTLMEAGRLTLEQRVNGIVKEFDTDLHRGIAVSHLLSHSSGLAPDTESASPPRNTREFMRYALRGPLLAPPGEHWAPSVSGFAVLGEIVKRVSGMEYEEYVKRCVLDPLGMNDTHFTVPKEKKERICRTGKGKDDGARVKGKDPLAAASGLHSTLPDLCRFGGMMLGNGRLGDARIVSRKSVEAMTANRLRDVPAEEGAVRLDRKQYGYGWSIARRSIVSPSAFESEAAGRAALVVDPAEELVAVFFVPAAGAPVPEAVLSALTVVWSGLA